VEPAAEIRVMFADADHAMARRMPTFLISGSMIPLMLWHGIRE
jgi:hypothetical protein